jgi:hypothetical protein
MPEQVNKILLPQDVEESFLKITSEFGIDKRIEFSLDPNSYNYIFEEFISRGAIGMLLLPTSGYIKNLDTYEVQLRKRTLIADKKLKTFNLLNLIFKSIAQELNINIEQCQPNSTFNYQRAIVFNEQHYMKRQLLKCFAIAYENTYSFLIGLKENIQISIKLPQTINALISLKCYCNGANSRRNCAILIGVLQTYKPVSIPGLSLQKSSANLDLVKNFKHFIKDELYIYISYSHHAFSLGNIGINIQRTIDNIGRAVNKLIKKGKYNETIDFGTKIITASTGVPIPSYKALENLVNFETFLPPIINLADILNTAKENWIQQNQSSGFIDLGTDIMKDALDIEHPLEYTFQNVNKNKEHIILKMTSRFDGKNIVILMTPNKSLQKEIIDIFKDLHKWNYSTSVSCEKHKSTTSFSDLTLRYSDSKIECRFTPCCEENYIRTIAQLVSVDK